MRGLRVPLSHRLDDLAPTQGPVPAQPGPGQVLVQMKALGLNYRDLLVATGHDRWLSPEGRVLGSDGVGYVMAVGPQTDRLRVGDRIITTILPNWVSGPLNAEKRSGALGGPAADGVFAEVVLLSAAGLALAPRYLDDVQAATLPVAALTAWHALTRAGVLRPGAVVLVEGTGGVSTFALQIAAAAGAKVIATSSSESKLKRLRELGAEATVSYRDRPDWGRQVLELTGGRGVDLAIDIGGASTLQQSITAAAAGATVSIVGLVGGLTAQIDLADVFQKNLRLDGIETGSRTMLEEMIAWFETRKLIPVIDSCYSFNDGKRGFIHLRDGGHIGKICLTL